MIASKPQPQPQPQQVPRTAANARERKRESERTKNENVRCRSSSRDRIQSTKKGSSKSGNSYSRSLIVNRSDTQEANITAFIMESAQFDLTTSNKDTEAAIRQAVNERKVATFAFENDKFSFESVNNAFLSGDINMSEIKCFTQSDETVRDMIKNPKYK